MTPGRSSRVVWVGLLVSAILFQVSQFSPAQTSAWDPGVGKDLFKDDLTPPDKKNPKKPQKPIHRLAPTTCDDCQKIVDQLQAALDDWSALELADANDTISKSVTGAQTDVSQADARAQKEDALAGLGQKERPPPKDKNKADVKKEIKKLSDALQDCLKKCAGGGEKTPTPTPTPKPVDDGGTGKTVNPPPVFDIKIPPLPPCFDSERDRQAHRDKLDELQKKLTTVKKKYGVEFAEPPDNAWKEFKEKWEKAIKEINDQAFPGDDGKSKIDKVPICPKGGGGPGKGPGKGKGKAPRIATGGNISLPGESFDLCISRDNVAIAIIGTGETIGHVADVRIDNLTDQPINCSLPPMVLESGSGKNQDYVVPHGQDVALRPHESKTVPMDGVCVNRHKPPVGNGIGGDLVINDPTGNVPRDSHSHLKRGNADKMLRLCTAKYDAVDKLQKDGALKDLPYRDKEKQKDICVQWSTWTDPRISETEGGNPATKDDLKKVVYKQVEEHGPVTPDKKKKIDQGIDTIFDKIELTNEKAKDLEKPEGETIEETPPVGGPEYIGQTGFGHTQAKKPTPTPTPKPKGGGKTKSAPTPTPTPTPSSGDTTQEKPKEETTPTEEETPLPMPSYPYSRETDCGTITISIGENGELVFDFKKNDKCPCKKYGWIQHFSNADYNAWYYDNGTGEKGSEKTGAKSDPDKPKQPTTPPKGKKDWPENPWYGGTTDEKKAKNGFDKHPEPQEHISDTPTHPHTKFRIQLVCVDTGEVIFTWAWGPVRTGKEKLDQVGGAEIEPPPKKK
jgi:hypothetical protein